MMCERVEAESESVSFHSRHVNPEAMNVLGRYQGDPSPKKKT